MKFSSSVLVSLFLYFIAAATSASASVVDAITPEDTSGPGRHRRTLSSKKNPAATVAAAAAIRELAVQVGPDCLITQQASTGIYTLRAIIGNATTLFSERPVRTARTMATPTFVEWFERYFNTSQPNAAITFTGNKDSTTTASADDNNGPLIAVLSQASLIGTTSLLFNYIVNSPAKGKLLQNSLEDRYTGIEYTLSQSESQAAVGSIQQFLDMSGSCSIFIDGFSGDDDDDDESGDQHTHDYG